MFYFQELVSMPSKSRDWKGIFISLLVILSVVGMVLISIKVVTPPPGPPRITGARMELNQINRGEFQPNNIFTAWTSGKNIVDVVFYVCNM